MNTHFVYLVNTEPSKVKRNSSGFDIANMTKRVIVV